LACQCSFAGCPLLFRSSRIMAIRKPSTTPKARPIKARKVDTVTPKCEAVRSAVLASAELPKSAAAMIAGMSGSALSTYKSSRHQYQTDTVDMIGDVLRATESAMQKSIAEKEAKSSQAVTIKTSRQEDTARAEANLAQKKETAAGTQAAIVTATGAHQAAQTVRKAAESNQKAEDKKLQVATDKKNQLVSFQNGTFVPLRMVRQNLRLSTRRTQVRTLLRSERSSNWRKCCWTQLLAPCR